MMKLRIVTFILLVCLLTACNSIKEYNGVKITKITHKTVDYMGGYTVIDELDFILNTYSSVGYLPEEYLNYELQVKSTFTDSEEKVFMDYCYSYGLFDLKESYSTSENIADGGSWDLIIEYEDGTIKNSRGNNAGPKDVFNKCVTVFYDLCGSGVVGYVPTEYITPPNISYSFRTYIDDTSVSSNDIALVVRADYLWNKHQSTNNNYFTLNEAIKDQNDFHSDYSYKLVVSTRNYDYEEKFIKITITEYDYNSELTNKKIIYTNGFISKNIMQVEIEIKLNKIYVYELSFKDGDYVQYTFNTYCNN